MNQNNEQAMKLNPFEAEATRRIAGAKRGFIYENGNPIGRYSQLAPTRSQAKGAQIKANHQRYILNKKDRPELYP